jgi:thiamine phosphate synthase YjbQ (UPF0047 family)
MIKTASIELDTRGNSQIVDITAQVAQAVLDSGLTGGIVTVFCPSATSGVTTIEFESGAVQDFQRLLTKSLHR